MNLLEDIWLPIIRKNGIREKIAIHQLLNHYKENPVMELEAPRPDFRNALYQLIIGIIQVAAIPEDEEEWSDLFAKPYRLEAFSKKVLKYKECFEIDSEGPAFMQDYNLPEGEEKGIATLLIDAPGGKTIKDNQDHFIKHGLVKQMDIYWAAIALYTMQTFAPSGGVGHRVGLRGGGPLTTMLIPGGSATLWEKIWINIISKEFLPIILGDRSLHNDSDIFPWMKPTKLSNSKGSELFVNEVHPFHHFFGMPRRVRLNFSYKVGKCDLTGEESTELVASYITKNYGNNYDGTWKHPLNAYTYDPKKPEKFPISIKGQRGGVGYRHWLGLVVESDRVIPSSVVKLFIESNYRKTNVKGSNVILWAAGYDMDNMKARCWYESIMPVYPLNTSDAREVTRLIGGFVLQAKELSSSLRFAVKSAWFGSPKDAKGNMGFIDTAFWQNTESEFYSTLNQFVEDIYNEELRNNLIDNWGKILRKETEDLFNAHALAQQEDGLDMKRVVKARIGLDKGIAKMIKNLKSMKELEE